MMPIAAEADKTNTHPMSSPELHIASLVIFARPDCRADTIDYLNSVPACTLYTEESRAALVIVVEVDQEGSITWETQPSNLVFDDGTEVSIAFGNASDSCSSFLGLGCGLSAQVSATTTLQSVPEPGTLVLLGGGLFGFAAVSRRRRRRASFEGS